MPLARGYFAPCRFEAEVFDCEVTGALPADLRGAFYRMHLDWFYPPKYPDEASLSADGYISMFRFREGVVDYRGRYVRTERFEAQRKARRQLYGYYRNPFTDEESEPFTAHPKVDPATGETIAFGYEATGLCSKDVFLYIFDKAGTIKREIRFQVPYTSMIHDI